MLSFEEDLCSESCQGSAASAASDELEEGEIDTRDLESRMANEILTRIKQAGAHASLGVFVPGMISNHVKKILRDNGLCSRIVGGRRRMVDTKIWRP